MPSKFRFQLFLFSGESLQLGVRHRQQRPDRLHRVQPRLRAAPVLNFLFMPRSTHLKCTCFQFPLTSYLSDSSDALSILLLFDFSSTPGRSIHPFQLSSIRLSLMEGNEKRERVLCCTVHKCNFEHGECKTARASSSHAYADYCWRVH